VDFRKRRRGRCSGTYLSPHLGVWLLAEGGHADPGLKQWELVSENEAAHDYQMGPDQSGSSEDDTMLDADDFARNHLTLLVGAGPPHFRAESRHSKVRPELTVAYSTYGTVGAGGFLHAHPFCGGCRGRLHLQACRHDTGQ
jgi:hypothetical protein